MNITDKEFKQLTDFVKQNYGINLTEKRTLVMGRLQNVLLQKNFTSYQQYIDYVTGDRTGEAITILVNKLTTNHTFFLRENSHFQYFRSQVLPYLKAAATNKDLRIWSAGCSTGEEPYTLAMIIADFFGAEKALWDARILATDISQRVLQIAEKGVYQNEQLTQVSDGWKRGFFVKVDSECSRVNDKIRNEVIFRLFNLNNKTFPFQKKFHVIFCRNVMIYFDNQTKGELVKRFYEHLEPGGYFFIGHSESLNRDETSFRYIAPSIYRKE